MLCQKCDFLKQSFFVIILLMLASACTYDFVEVSEPDPIDPTDTISFKTVVAPIFSDGNKMYSLPFNRCYTTRSYARQGLWCYCSCVGKH